MSIGIKNARKCINSSPHTSEKTPREVQRVGVDALRASPPAVSRVGVTDNRDHDVRRRRGRHRRRLQAGVVLGPVGALAVANRRQRPADGRRARLDRNKRR